MPSPGIARALPPDVAIVASDLNRSMLDHAATTIAGRAIDWQQADAMHLPFPDASFDVVACQFGAMFFPDKAVAFAEARRVLRPDGTYFFSVWDRLEDNEFAEVVVDSLAGMFPDDPPRFLARTPHGYHDEAVIASDVARGGWTAPPTITTLTERSRAATPREPALAYCEGTPMRNEIEARGEKRLAEATDVATAAIAHRFGHGAVDDKIQALVVEVRR